MGNEPEVQVDVKPGQDEAGAVEAMREAVTGRMTAEQAARDAEEARQRAEAAQAEAGATGGVLGQLMTGLGELKDQVAGLLAERDARQLEEETPTETVIAPVEEPPPAPEEGEGEHAQDEPEGGTGRIAHLLW